MLLNFLYFLIKNNKQPEHEQAVSMVFVLILRENTQNWWQTANKWCKAPTPHPQSTSEGSSQVDFRGFETGQRQSRAGDGNPARPSLGVFPFRSPITTLEVCAEQLHLQMMVPSSQALPVGSQGIFWWNRGGMVWVGRDLKLTSFQGTCHCNSLLTEVQKK